MHSRFGLVLMLTHACNLRCRYCYGGAKSERVLPEALGRQAIDRALASLAPGGTLELSFFGGEPLLEADLLARLLAYARTRTTAAGLQLTLSLTTNGTITTPQAWSILTLPDLDLALSHDGLPAVHDRHRTLPDGRGSSARVLDTLRRLRAAGKDFHVIMVVRPDTLEFLPEGIRFLQNLGVRHIEPSLDLWTPWSGEDETRLEQVIARCAELWRAGLPHYSIGWFDEKVAHLAQVPLAPTARCGFGHGELAVAPSGRLYPCERLIGDDHPDNPMALSGHVLEGEDFLHLRPAPSRNEEACGQCTMAAMCNTFCRCSNYIRSGDVSRPDRLLCRWNQACLLQTASILEQLEPQNVNKH